MFTKNGSDAKNEKGMAEIDFGPTPDVLKEDYLNVYEGIQSEIVNTLLDGTECQLLLDTGASKSFMSKSFYIHCKSLHSLPKFASKTKRIQVGNGQFISVLFVILVIIEVNRHRFEIYTLVSKMNENLDLVLGMKNIFKLEGVVNLGDCCFKFLNRSLPIFSIERVVLKPIKQKVIKGEAPFIDDISGLAIIKILDGSTYSTMLIKLKFMCMLIKLKFMCNIAILDIVNNDTETIIFNLKK